ncbi:hypothetical protein D9757_012052 [Collybiopsis confluens]|uniref:Transaldolase n=1 Tax=Collybiopsis confluens TaxID=2823264 RepID=A0A8H5FW90_9AGAR|nr:hypothetical protein D9757_012052 [Collybiopsis confluens]
MNVPAAAEASVQPDSKTFKPLRPLPKVPPSNRLKAQDQVEMDVDEPERRETLGQSFAVTKTLVVGETFNRSSLSTHKPDASEITPRSILSSEYQSKAYDLFAATQKVIDIYEKNNDMKDIFEKEPNLSQFRIAVLNHLVVEMGINSMEVVKGPHFTFIDPLCAFPEDPISGFRATGGRAISSSETSKAVSNIVEQVRRLHSTFLDGGIASKRVFISIPATECGVIAAARLEKEFDIRTNLYLVSGLMHAIACAEASAAWITIDVAKILCWYESLGMLDDFTNRQNLFPEALVDHPGVIAIQSILRYYRLHSIKTLVVGRNFRSSNELSLLGGEFDALSLSKIWIQKVSSEKLPVCLPGFSSTRRIYVDPRRQISHPMEVPVDSVASRVARAAPFPTSMLTQDDRHPSSIASANPFSVKEITRHEPGEWNLDWTQSMTFWNAPTMSEGYPTAPQPLQVFTTIVSEMFVSLDANMKKIHAEVRESSLNRVRLRIFPKDFLTQGNRRDIWWEWYHEGEDEELVATDSEPETEASGAVQVPVGNGKLERKASLLWVLGKGNPSSSITRVHVSSSSSLSTTPHRPPSARRPPIRRSPSFGKNGRPALSPSTSLTTIATDTTPDGYASDDEVSKVLAMAFGAQYAVNKAGKGKMQAGGVKTDASTLSSAGPSRSSSGDTEMAIIGGMSRSSQEVDSTTYLQEERWQHGLNELSAPATTAREAKQKESILIEDIDYF